MKRAGELMKEMGFREDASVGAQEAFLKHLIKASMGVDVKTPTEVRSEKSKQWTEQQLSFDLDSSTGPKKVG